MEPPIDPDKCLHPQSILTCRPDKNGNKRYQRQCVVCWQPVDSRWVAKADAAKEGPLGSLPPFDEKARQRVWDRRKQFDSCQVEFDLAQFKPAYEEYLRSPAWLKKRDLVLKRTGGVCEGCGTERATQVHHFSYANLGNEFLWELAAVCAKCHDRAHPWKLDDRRPSAEMRRMRLHRDLECSSLFKEWIAKREID